MLESARTPTMHDELKSFLTSGNQVYNSIGLCKSEFDVLGTFKKYYESGSLLSLSAASVTIYASLISVAQDDPALLDELWSCISTLAALHAFLALSTVKLTSKGQVFDLHGHLFNEHWKKCVNELTKLYGDSLILSLREKMH